MNNISIFDMFLAITLCLNESFSFCYPFHFYVKCVLVDFSCIRTDGI